MSNNKFVFLNGTVVTPSKVLKPATVFVEGGTISKVTEKNSLKSRAGWRRIDCAEKIVMPGFIDVHTHGGTGFDFKDESPDAIAKLSDYYYSHGVTTLLATLSPLPHRLLIPAVKRLVKFCRENRGKTNIAGIHLEGPYINGSMSGGNRKDYVERPDFERWREVVDAGEGFIRLMTVAPEVEGIDPIIEDAVKNGIVISLGHSTAGARAASSAIRLGATQVTHLFNAMPGLHHREPGLLSAALLSDSLDAQLIADGIHVHPDFIRLALRAKTRDHLMLITDSMRAAGLPDGEYDSAGNRVRVENGVSRMPDGTLAGSTLTFENGLKLVASLNEINLCSTSRITSLNAARSLGIHRETGSIVAGKCADIVVLGPDFSVEMTMKNGEVEYGKGKGEKEKRGKGEKEKGER